MSPGDDPDWRYARRILGLLTPLVAFVLTVVAVVGLADPAGGARSAPAFGAASPSAAPAPSSPPGNAASSPPGNAPSSPTPSTPTPATTPVASTATPAGTPSTTVSQRAATASGLTPLPGGRPRFVVSMIGGSFNRYWVRLAQYTFTPGTNGTGTVSQSYWMWHQAHFSGNAKLNKVRTGYVTAGCSAACGVRAPRGYQPGTGPMASLTGRYRFDRLGRLVIRWPGGWIEAWTVRTSRPEFAKMTLFRTTLGGLYGDALGSIAPLTTGATRDQVAASYLTGVQRVASFGLGGRYPIRTSRWTSNVVASMRRCGGVRSACLFHTGRVWRSAMVVPSRLGRRAYWQHQKQGIDGNTGACFSPGGGHTVALLQALDDSGDFAGFVGVEASFNGHSPHNAVVAQLVLT